MLPDGTHQPRRDDQLQPLRARRGGGLDAPHRRRPGPGSSPATRGCGSRRSRAAGSPRRRPRCDTPHGRVEVSWEIVDGELTVEADLPEGVTGGARAAGPARHRHRRVGHRARTDHWSSEATHDHASHAITDRLEAQAIELPSWAFGNSGTRFKVFGTPGTPRTVQEKLADAAKVNEFTGLAPSVALHIPWDMVDDFGALGRYAADLGVRLGNRQLQHLPGRRLQVRQPDPRRPTRRSGRRRSTTTSSASR